MTTDSSAEFSPSAVQFPASNIEMDRAQRATSHLIAAAKEFVRSVRDNTKTFDIDATFALAVTAVVETTTATESDYDTRLSLIGGSALSLARAEIFDEEVIPGLISPDPKNIKKMTKMAYGRIANSKGKFIPRAEPTSALDVLDSLYREQLAFQHGSVE